MMRSEAFDPTSKAFRLSGSPFYLIAHADFKYHEDMEAVMVKRGLNKSIYRILTVLRENEPSSISHLADTALIKRSTVSRIVDRMRELGLVTTANNSEDSRITEVSMTAEGRRTLDSLTPMVARQFNRATQGVTEQELNQLVRTLQRIIANLSRLPIEEDFAPDGRSAHP